MRRCGLRKTQSTLCKFFNLFILEFRQSSVMFKKTAIQLQNLRSSSPCHDRMLLAIEDSYHLQCLPPGMLPRRVLSQKVD
jgi:hypothetical protein